jgi:predicted metalloendopeptidase
MRTVTLAFIAAASGLVAACSSTSPAAPPPPAQVSGIDLTTADKAIRPQDDLFHHVNGGWLASTDIPADRAAWGAFDMLAEKTREDLRVIAEDAAKATDRAPGSDAQKIGDFYNSFMDEATVETKGLAPLQAQLAAIDALETRADLARYFAEALTLNISNPVVGYVEGDAAEPNISIFYLFQSGLGLPDRDYYLKDDAKLKEYREKYKAFLTTILTQAGQARPDQTAADIIALETRLARLHWTNVENRDAVKTYNKVATADLAKQFPGFEWQAWMDALGLAGAPNVVVSQPSYLKGFAALYAQMPVSAWKPYLKASLINSYAPYLSKAYADADFEFYS